MITNNFYLFSSKFSSKTVQVHLIDELKYTKIDSLCLGNFDGLKFPLTFRQKYGKNKTDLLDTGYPYLFIISKKIKRLIEQNNLNGCKFFDIKVFDKFSEELENYFGFSIVGRCGPIDFSKSPVIRKKLIENGPEKEFHKGIYFDKSTWDGTDFFFPEGSFKLIVTKKAYDLIKDAKCSNISLKNINEIEYLKL